MSAFAAAAEFLTEAGLAVLPLGGADGKRPLVKWGRWKHPPGLVFVRTLVRTYPDANIGVICGLSHVTVVDIDDADLLPEMLERFGNTPLRTFTPSGGAHLWYSSSGEGCHNLRKSEGLAIDIKGIGGQVVVPPSVRFNGENAGRAYGFLSGSWDDIRQIPTIHLGSLTRPSDHLRSGNGTTPAGARIPKAIGEGSRNSTLFCCLLRHAKACDHAAALFDVAETINADFDPPLTAAEVAKITALAWSYETTGRNWAGKEQRAYATKSEWEALAAQRNGGDGCLLFTKLRMVHWKRGEPEFPVSSKAMAQAQTIPGWGAKRYRAALNAILDAKLLRQAHRGGARPGDASLFSFSAPATHKGASGEPNIIKTPPLPGLPPSVASVGVKVLAPLI